MAFEQNADQPGQSRSTDNTVALTQNDNHLVIVMSLGIAQLFQNNYNKLNTALVRFAEGAREGVKLPLSPGGGVGGIAERLLRLRDNSGDPQLIGN